MRMKYGDMLAHIILITCIHGKLTTHDAAGPL